MKEAAESERQQWATERIGCPDQGNGVTTDRVRVSIQTDLVAGHGDDPFQKPSTSGQVVTRRHEIGNGGRDAERHNVPTYRRQGTANVVEAAREARRDVPREPSGNRGRSDKSDTSGQEN